MKLFEIMLRPTIIIIATVGSMLIFGGSLHFFNNAFAMYYSSFMDTSSGVAGMYMFIGSTFIYVLTVYSIGNSCFKMIPTIANNFMNWIGGPNGFSGIMQADIEKLAGAAAVAGALNVANQAGQFIDRGMAKAKEGKGAEKATKHAQDVADTGKTPAGFNSLSKKDKNLYNQLAQAGGAGGAEAGAGQLRSAQLQKKPLK
jgi:hypothetical protein